MIPPSKIVHGILAYTYSNSSAKSDKGV